MSKVIIKINAQSKILGQDSLILIVTTSDILQKLSERDLQTKPIIKTIIEQEEEFHVSKVALYKEI